jgi:hypothetical protein
LTVDLFFVVFCCAGQSENPELGTWPPEYSEQEREAFLWREKRYQVDKAKYLCSKSQSQTLFQHL